MEAFLLYNWEAHLIFYGLCIISVACLLGASIQARNNNRRRDNVDKAVFWGIVSVLGLGISVGISQFFPKVSWWGLIPGLAFAVAFGLTAGIVLSSEPKKDQKASEEE